MFSMIARGDPGAIESMNPPRLPVASNISSMWSAICAGGAGEVMS